MRDDYIDFHRVADEHQEVHSRLKNWARWVRVSPREGWTSSPMWRQVKSLVRQWHLPEHRESIDLLDAVLIERLVVRLPAPHRDAIRWCYVFGGDPVKFAGRLRVSKEMLHRYVEDGRRILTREIKRSRDGVLTSGVS